MSQITVPITREQLVALDDAAKSAGLSREGLAVQYITAGLDAPKPGKKRTAKSADKEA
jgi:hypothetical protein